MSKPWMPLYVADYLSDTGHLTTAQHGAYLLLIMHYWKRGGLPTDDTQLAQIARMTVREWGKAKATIAAFFGENWTHERINKELAHAEEISSKRSAAGKQKGSNSSSSDEQKHTQSPSQSPREEKKDIRAVASATRPADRFDDFWKAYPRRDGANPKTPARKKFDALVKSGVDPGEIISAASRYAAEMRAKGQERTPYVAQAMTWLGQQRHGDYGEPEPEQPIDAPGFYAAFSSPQLEAWDEYERSIGKRKPRDKAGGWRYETEWPPKIEGEQAA